MKKDYKDELIYSILASLVAVFKKAKESGVPDINKETLDEFRKYAGIIAEDLILVEDANRFNKAILAICPFCNKRFVGMMEEIGDGCLEVKQWARSGKGG